MIIVSQDKKELINFNNMENIEIDNPFENNDGKFTIEATSIDTNSYFLGEYDTEERAKEVLQEIVETYKSQDIEIYNKEPVNEFYKQDFLKEILHKKVVYEMPEE